MMAAMITGVFGPRPWSRSLSFGGIAILILIEFGAVQRHPSRAVLTTVATAVACGAWLLLTTRLSGGEHSLTRLMLLVILGAAAIGLALASPEGAAIIPAIVAMVAASRIDQRPGLAFAAALTLGYLLATARSIGLQPIPLLSYGLGLTFTYLASRSTAQLRDEQARTKALLVELQQNRDAQIQAAALDERARIAREIHDVLAHTLAALSVQLEGARVMLEQRHADPEAVAAVDRAHRLAKEGLDETRQAVSALRGDQIPGPAQLARLVEDFQRDTGTTARLEVEGPARPLSSEAQLTFYRTAQEALTNIRKHAKPEQVEVRIRYRPTSTDLIVEDHGALPANGASPVVGYGLIGMRERAELLGGTLDAHPTTDGFRVALQLPA
jgi:signal transduction histidine kinase